MLHYRKEVHQPIMVDTVAVSPNLVAIGFPVVSGNEQSRRFNSGRHRGVCFAQPGLHDEKALRLLETLPPAQLMVRPLQFQLPHLSGPAFRP